MKTFAAKLFHITILFLIPCFAFSNGTTTYADSILTQAEEAYKRGEFEFSIELYNKLINGGYSSAELFYNTGNAFYKSNKLGKAILYYEKSLLLNPGDEDAKYNLELAKTKIVDKPQEIQRSFIGSIWASFRNLLKAKLWGILSVALFSFTFISITFLFISKQTLYKKISFYASVSLLFLAIITLIFTRQQYNMAFNNRFGIIMSPTLTVKSSPDDNSTNLFIVHEGTKAEVTDTIGEWFEIRLSDGKTGWIKSNSLERI